MKHRNLIIIVIIMTFLSCSSDDEKQVININGTDYKYISIVEEVDGILKSDSIARRLKRKNDSIVLIDSKIMSQTYKLMEQDASIRYEIYKLKDEIYNLEKRLYVSETNRKLRKRSEFTPSREKQVKKKIDLKKTNIRLLRSKLFKK